MSDFRWNTKFSPEIAALSPEIGQNAFRNVCAIADKVCTNNDFFSNQKFRIDDSMDLELCLTKFFRFVSADSGATSGVFFDIKLFRKNIKQHCFYSGK